MGPQEEIVRAEDIELSDEIPPSAFIQEWPLDKLTVADLKALLETIAALEHYAAKYDKVMPSGAERARDKIKVALERAREKGRS